MNMDQIKGRIQAALGKLEQVTGEVVGNKRLARQGLVNSILGGLKALHGDVKAQMRRGSMVRIRS